MALSLYFWHFPVVLSAPSECNLFCFSCLQSYYKGAVHIQHIYPFFSKSRAVEWLLYVIACQAPISNPFRTSEAVIHRQERVWEHLFWIILHKSHAIKWNNIPVSFKYQDIQICLLLNKQNKTHSEGFCIKQFPWQYVLKMNTPSSKIWFAIISQVTMTWVFQL